MAQNGGVRLEGTSQAMRVDHCYLDFTSSLAESFAVNHNGWGGATNGDGAWADDTAFGSNKFLFIEDCTFNRLDSGGGLDCYGGGRYVARYNRFNNLGVNSHGTETTNRHR